MSTRTLCNPMLILTLITAHAYAATYTLRPDGSGDYPTIQEAIDAAADGDVIQLENGIYTGAGNQHLDFLGKSITLSGPGDPKSTVIRATDNTSISLQFQSGERSDTIITGIFFETRSEIKYQLMNCINTSPTFINCWFVGNNGYLHFDTSNVTFDKCWFDSFRQAQEASIFTFLNGSPRFKSCWISDNDGALMSFSQSDISIDGCDIFYNYQGEEEGHGIRVYKGGISILNSNFVNNNWTKDYSLILKQTEAYISNCDFNSNKYGLYAGSSQITLFNSDIRYHDKKAFYASGSNCLIKDCLFLGNKAPLEDKQEPAIDLVDCITDITDSRLENNGDGIHEQPIPRYNKDSRLTISRCTLTDNLNTILSRAKLTVIDNCTISSSAAIPSQPRFNIYEQYLIISSDISGHEFELYADDSVIIDSNFVASQGIIKDAIVINCNIKHCSGLYSAYCMFSDCLFENNDSRGSYFRNCIEGRNTIYDRCLFINNRATDMVLAGPDCEYINSLMIGNEAKYLLSALERRFTPNLNILGCTIANNTYSGASLFREDGNSTITNSIIYGNKCLQNPDHHQVLIAPGAEYYISYSCIQNWPADPILGIINDNPQFISLPDDGGDGWYDLLDTPDFDEAANNDYGDLRLRRESPCIDAGDSTAFPTNLNTDLDGNLRILDVPGVPDTGIPSTKGRVVDMGAYEFDPQGDWDEDGVANAGDYCPATLPGLTVDDQGCSPAMIGDDDRDGDVDRVDILAFGQCLSGPAIPASPNCFYFDYDQDNDVDMADFGPVQRCLSGRNISATDDCQLP